MSGTCGAEGKWDLGAVQTPDTSVAPEPLLLAGLESRAELSSPFSQCAHQETFGTGYRESAKEKMMVQSVLGAALLIM